MFLHDYILAYEISTVNPLGLTCKKYNRSRLSIYFYIFDNIE